MLSHPKRVATLPREIGYANESEVNFGICRSELQSNQGRSQEFDLGGYKSKSHTGHWHDIEFVLGQGDKTTT